jgi:endonuclease/exonuclease/phosphatase family metal-dependent hydrolase
MKRILVVILLAVPLSPSPFNAFQNKSHPSSAHSDNGGSSLLESGTGAAVKTIEKPPSEFKVVSYNIRWRSGDDLKQLIKLLREDPEIGNATILGLQEVDRKKKRSRNSHVAKQMADELNMHYAWAAPPPEKGGDEEETGVAILSVYPMTDVRRLVLPHEGPNGRRRVAIGATLRIHDQSWRVYSAHGETRLSLNKKIEQYKSILDDLARFPSDMPAIVLGDLNTWEADSERKTIKLFYEAGLRTPFGNQNTFRRRILMVPIEFRLDWVWLRGLEASSYGIDRKVGISDHWPLWTNVKVLSANGKASTAKQ